MDEVAIQKIFSIKSRPLNHPLIMHVAKTWDLNSWVDYIPKYAQKLMDLFWPGPLTLVFKLNRLSQLSPMITGGQDSVAIRCPNHGMTLQVLSELQKPIVAPSANPFGRVSPTQAMHVYQDFMHEDFYILDGGPCEVGIESTILDARTEDSVEILRQGRVSAWDLQPLVNIHKSTSTIKVSGRLKQHYQPGKPLFYFEAEDFNQIDAQVLQSSAVLSFSPVLSIDHPNAFLFPDGPYQAAQMFYAQLRMADKTDAKQILIELPPSLFSWAGLRDRIMRAGQPFINSFDI